VTRRQRGHDPLRVAAGLHIVSGACILLALSVALAYVAASYAGSGLQGDLKAILGTVGIVVGTALSVIAGLELVGGVAHLAGLAIGRPLLILCSAFQLANVPLGTALAIFTFWALSRR
jgi:hypothetical protein